MKERLLEEAKHIEPELIRIRRAFHEEPEISRHEVKTAEKIRTGVAGNGILADLDGGKQGKKIALRADMDALSIQEETGLPFASKNDGVMHACGHDNHMTCLLGAAMILKKYQSELPGSVRLIFQPAEELSPTGGSRAMISEGALEDVDAVFGLHVFPDCTAGKIAVKVGPQMAASDHFSIQITGASSHGAMPHQGKDALLAGAQFVTAVQNIVSRNTDPLEPCVVTIGIMKAGTRYNIVPGECYLEGTVRTYSPEVRATAKRRLREVLDGICLAMGCRGELNYEDGYCALRNDPVKTEYMHGVIRDLFGAENDLTPEKPAMTAEDFAFYLEEKPGAFAWLGTQAEDDPEVWPLHSSRYKANEAVLWRGAAFLAGLVMESESMKD